jgi:NADPH2:quinone reductase
MLNQCAVWLDQGRLKIHLSEQMELKDAAEAHKRIEGGHTQGKIVLTM